MSRLSTASLDRIHPPIHLDPTTIPWAAIPIRLSCAPTEPWTRPQTTRARIAWIAIRVIACAAMTGLGFAVAALIDR